ncbi:gliding motility-associated C-terminal domain-containing protein [Hymenobacter negativus]|uniref:Gliding motility-associated C-terminal domain-containing protein n=1 Tax=Hymenobacter negativus TaxID=2795026 RepID=A0ABS3QDB6_9BACT|nr:gliding motility-associated C-terminal domain-containing protein [Hymenobacter negativus]MBO2009111.1 gliding motility-associated C-terminal domain-containing protein [Hymenobacter negativus]
MKNYCLRLLWGLLIGCLPLLASAQGEYSNWYFGRRADLHFAPAGGAPRPLLGSAMTATSGCATLSDAAGNLLLYSNGEQVWNRQHQLMPGGQSLGGNTLVAQGCAVVRVQGTATPTAYLFTQRYTSALSAFVTGTPIAAEIQLNGAGGLGQVTQTGLPVVADTILQRLGERQFAPYQALVRHANGRECWLLTRLHQQGIFLATLLDGSGQWPCRRTVVSRVLPTRISSSTTFPGALVASPDGRTLLYNDVATSFLMSFDPATGQVSTPLQLVYPTPTIPSSINPYALSGIFSSDGTRLYVNRIYQPSGNYGSAVQVIQYDLSAGNSAATATTGIEIYSVASSGNNGLPWYGQRGPDGIIYFSVTESASLDAILSPNARGRACRYSPGYQSLGGRTSLQSLPVQPNDVNLGALLAPEGAFGCAGQRLTLRAGAGAGGTATDSLRWLLGDGRRAITTLVATDSLSISYPAPGTYTLRLDRRRQGVVVASATASVRISATPQVRLTLAPDTVGCTPLSLRLSVGPQPAGSVFSWQDGSRGATLVATTPGTYWVDVQNPAGCTVRATVQVRERPCAAPTVTIPNIITPNGDDQNQAFVLRGLVPADWSLRLYNRWGSEIYKQASYDNSWAAQGQPDGVYYYLLTNATTSQKLKGWVEVRR